MEAFVGRLGGLCCWPIIERSASTFKILNKPVNYRLQIIAFDARQLWHRRRWYFNHMLHPRSAALRCTARLVLNQLRIRSFEITIPGTAFRAASVHTVSHGEPSSWVRSDNL